FVLLAAINNLYLSFFPLFCFSRLIFRVFLYGHEGGGSSKVAPKTEQHYIVCVHASYISVYIYMNHHHHASILIDEKDTLQHDAHEMELTELGCTILDLHMLRKINLEFYPKIMIHIDYIIDNQKQQIILYHRNVKTFWRNVILHSLIGLMEIIQHMVLICLLHLLMISRDMGRLIQLKSG
ncbi:hypothetical protein ACJX0J_039375, partial [Zea mays]